MSGSRLGQHKVWGEPEVLSCYSSSGTGTPSGGQGSSKNGGTKERRFPQELQQYLRSSVAKVAADDNSEESSGKDKGRLLVPGSSSAGPSGPGPAPGRYQAASAESEEGEEGELGSEEQNGRGLASAGSALHHLRQCRPCMYVSSKTGCIKGQDCQYCHLAHPKKNRPRPCKATRLQCKQLASMLDVLSADAEQMIKATEVLGDNAAYMRTVLRGKQRQLAGEADSRAEAPSEDGKDDDVLSI